MSRTKKRQKLRFVARWPFWACLTFGLVGAASLWQQRQISALGAQITKNELRLEELRRVNAVRTRELAMMSSPREIEARIKQMRLDLVLPEPEQIVRLAETPVEEPRQVVRTAFAGQPAR